MATEAEPLSQHTNRGITLAIFHNPKTNSYHVAEATTGAFVGHGKTVSAALNGVERDLAAADPAVIKEQLKQAAEQSAAAPLVPAEEFWSKFRT